MPASLPLGVGGRPFEAAELGVPEGVRLVLFTDGFVEGRDRDIDIGFGLPRHNLSEVRGMTPEETCRAVFDAMVTGMSPSIPPSCRSSEHSAAVGCRTGDWKTSASPRS